MRIKIGRDIERYIKSRVHKFFLKQDDFTIISNNCWGTFMYKKFGLPYNSPFINLMMFGPDYIDMLENFSIDLLSQITFIEQEKSKHIDELKKLGIFGAKYPIGLLFGKYELHFLHYTTIEDAREKWFRRLKRINPKKMVFKFSDGDKFEENMAQRFDNLIFKNKVCFVSKKYPELKSMVSLKKFQNNNRVHDEWKNANKEFNALDFFNHIQTNEKVFHEN